MKRNQTVFFLTILGLLLITGCGETQQKKSLSPEQQAEYISKGKKITMMSFKALSSEVMKAIEAGGVEHAVAYCQVQANPLIDSLSKAHQAGISRVSDKFRNPVNKPGALDEKVLTAYRQQLDEGQELQPHLEYTGDTIIFYSPILILNPICLQCHGEAGSTMGQQTFEYIKSRYPDDQATGYKLGDLRGVWKIMFNV
jgi:hypothetical protein